MITEDLFTFPIVMVDGENEERKERDSNLYNKIGEEEQVEYDIIYGEAAYPYYDFVGFEDRWLPTTKSLQRALRKKFDACTVRFRDIGQFLVPMSKEKFKAMLDSFVESREPIPEETKGDVTVLKFTPDMLARLIASKEETDEKQGE